MSRGHSRNIGNKVRDAIITVKTGNSRLSANQVRSHLLWNYKEYGLGEKQIPSKRSIQNILAKYRLRIEKTQSSPLEKAWTILSLKDYPLLPEAMPTLLEIQNSESITNIFTIEEIGTKKKTTAKCVFTIRQARWASQLYPIIRVYTEGKSQSDVTSMLYKWARAYSELETINKITGRDEDSAYLDRRLFQSHGEVKPYWSEDEESIANIITDPHTWENLKRPEPKREDE